MIDCLFVCKNEYEFSRKINGVPNGEYIESDKFSVTAHGMDLEWQLCLYPAGTHGTQGLNPHAHKTQTECDLLTLPINNNGYPAGCDEYIYNIYG